MDADNEADRRGTPAGPMTVCERRDELRERYQGSLERYSDELCRLARVVCPEDREHAESRTEDARRGWESARLELSRHAAKHGCADLQVWR